MIPHPPETMALANARQRGNLRAMRMWMADRALWPMLALWVAAILTVALPGQAPGGEAEVQAPEVQVPEGAQPGAEAQQAEPVGIWLTQEAEIQVRAADGSRQPWTVRYRLWVPAGEGPFPLLVFLHGAGERGIDNERQMTLLPRRLAEEQRVGGEGPQQPHLILAVQCPPASRWVETDWSQHPIAKAPVIPSQAMQGVIAVLAEAVRKHPVDTRRILLTGLSMGGFGSWHLAARHPDWFAGVVPVCGGGDPRQAARLKDLPVWAWHGGSDPVVPVELSRDMVQAVIAAGGSPKYTEIPELGHGAWRPAYGEEGALQWLFEQRREAPASLGRRSTLPGVPVIPFLPAAPDEEGAAPDPFQLPEGARILVQDSSLKGLAERAARWFGQVHGKDLVVAMGPVALPAAIKIGLDGNLDPRAFRVTVLAGGLRIDGGGYPGVAHGVVAALNAAGIPLAGGELPETPAWPLGVAVGAWAVEHPAVLLRGEAISGDHLLAAVAAASRAMLPAIHVEWAGVAGRSFEESLAEDQAAWAAGVRLVPAVASDLPEESVRALPERFPHGLRVHILADGDEAAVAAARYKEWLPGDWQVWTGALGGAEGFALAAARVAESGSVVLPAAAAMVRAAPLPAPAGVEAGDGAGAFEHLLAWHALGWWPTVEALEGEEEPNIAAVMQVPAGVGAVDLEVWSRWVAAFLQAGATRIASPTETLPWTEWARRSQQMR